MRAMLLRWCNDLFLVLVLAAVTWSTLALGAVWGWGLAITFGLLAAAFCLWTALRIFASEAREMARQAATVPAESAEAEEAADDEEDAAVEASPAAGRRLNLATYTKLKAYRLAPRLRVRAPVGAVLLLLLVGCMILQVAPLPRSVVGLLSPRRVVLEQRFGEALNEAAPSLLTLSVDPENSRRALALAAMALMAFAAGAYLATRRRQARRAVRVLLLMALAEAAYGMFEELSGHHHLFWIPVEGDFARGTFFNRNHFAATLALLLPMSIGWFYFRAAAAKSRHDETHVLPATSWDILGSRQGLWLLAPAILVLAILQSQSRGGFASMALGVGLMFVIGARTKLVRRFAWLALPLALLVLASGVSSDYEELFARFGQQGVVESGRLRFWSDGLQIVRQYPIFGVGLGNFPRVYMQVSTGETVHYPFQAHNEWLEALITLGFVGAALALVMLIGFFAKAFRRIRRAGPDQPWLLGAWCGLCGLALHSVGEFNLHIPSIAITAALLAGMLLGFSTTIRARTHGQRSGTPRRSRRSRTIVKGSRRVIGTAPAGHAEPVEAEPVIESVPEDTVVDPSGQPV